MSEYDFSGELNLDPSSYVSGAEEAADASSVVTDSTGEMSDSLWDVDPAGVAAGGALAGIGTAAQGILDDTRDLREGLGRTAETMGITSDEATDLATDMSDATFPIEDVERTMDSLAQQGVTSADDMEHLATTMDDIADATGNTAESVADNVGPALRAMGEDVEDAEEHMDTFTHIARNTTMDLDDFSGMVQKLGPDLEEMGMDVDDTAAVMGALEEKGMDSRTAMREFRQASNEADGDQEELMESLGLTSDELEEQHDALADAEGMTESHAEAANDSVSRMDELRASFQDAKLEASAYLGPLSSLAPAAQAAGIGMMTMSTINMSAVVPSFAAVSAAALPITAVVLGVAAAATAAAVIWERDIGDIQSRTETAVEYITAGFETLVEGVEWAIDTASYILFEWSPQDTLAEKRDSMLEPIENVRERIPGDLDEATDLAMDVFTSWHPAGIIYDKRDEIMDALPSPQDFRDAASGLTDAFADGIRDNIPDVEGAVGSMADSASDYLPGSDADKGEFSRLTDAGAAVPSTMAGETKANAGELEESMAGMADQAALGPEATNDPRPGGQQTTERSFTRLEALLEQVVSLLEAPQEVEGELDVNSRRFDELVDARLKRAGRQAQ